MIGFANAEGGLIVIGIHDGVVEGVGSAGRRLNDWRQAALDHTRPPVRHRFEFLPCTNAKGDQDEIAVIEVESSERVHTDPKGDTYLRVGDENRRLGILEAQELRYDKGDSTFDGTPAELADIGSLEPELVERYCKRIRTSEPELALRARGLLTEGRDGALRPTVAGLLLFGTAPQEVFPKAFVRILRYRGSSRESGARANVVSDRRLEGPLVAQIEGARRLLRRWLPAAIRLDRLPAGSERFVEPLSLRPRDNDAGRGAPGGVATHRAALPPRPRSEGAHRARRNIAEGPARILASLPRCLTRLGMECSTIDTLPRMPNPLTVEGELGLEDVLASVRAVLQAWPYPEADDEEGDRREARFRGSWSHVMEYREHPPRPRCPGGEALTLRRRPEGQAVETLRACAPRQGP